MSIDLVYIFNIFLYLAKATFGNIFFWLKIFQRGDNLPIHKKAQYLEAKYH
jgi:hypothetical protein